MTNLIFLCKVVSHKKCCVTVKIIQDTAFKTFDKVHKYIFFMPWFLSCPNIPNSILCQFDTGVQMDWLGKIA